MTLVLKSPSKRVVVKIGGATLHASNDLADDVQRVVDCNSGNDLFLIVGGGLMIDAMRELHRTYPTLSDEAMHWRCIRLLDATWEIACELLPFAVPIATENELERALSNDRTDPRFVCHVFMVRIDTFYRQDLLASIPESWRPQVGWDTTSDAIGWLLAKRIGADRMVLLKQTANIDGLSVTSAANGGIVDRELSRLASIDSDRHRVKIELLGPR